VAGAAASVAASQARRSASSAPTLLARIRAVENDEPQRAEVGRILHGLTVRAGNAKVTAERKPVVVIAGEDIERRLERRQQVANLLVLGVGGMIGQIAGNEHRVRIRHEVPDRRDRGGKHRGGIPASPVRPDVGIAELDEQERSHRTIL
jgi:hypothetical protein